MADDIVKLKLETKFQSVPNYSTIVSSPWAIEFASWWNATRIRQQNLPEMQAEFGHIQVLNAIFGMMYLISYGQWFAGQQRQALFSSLRPLVPA